MLISLVELNVRKNGADLNKKVQRKLGNPSLPIQVESKIQPPESLNNIFPEYMLPKKTITENERKKKPLNVPLLDLNAPHLKASIAEGMEETTVRYALGMANFMHKYNYKTTRDLQNYKNKVSFLCNTGHQHPNKEAPPSRCFIPPPSSLCSPCATPNSPHSGIGITCNSSSISW